MWLYSLYSCNNLISFQTQLRKAMIWFLLGFLFSFFDAISCLYLPQSVQICLRCYLVTTWFVLRKIFVLSLHIWLLCLISSLYMTFYCLPLCQNGNAPCTLYTSRKLVDGVKVYVFFVHMLDKNKMCWKVLGWAEWWCSG